MEQLLERVNKLALPIKIGLGAGIAVLLTAASYFLLVQPIEDQIT